MQFRFARVVLAACAISGAGLGIAGLGIAGLGIAGLGVAMAQDAPPADTRCGGLLCDLGVINVTSNHHLDEGLPCGVFCRAFGGTPTPPPPPPQAQPIAETAPAEPAKKMHRAKRKHVAQARTAAPASDAATTKPN